VAALKTVVDSTRRHAEDWGAAVTAVVPGPASATPSRLNLLPLEARARRMRWRQWQVWLPTALVALAAVAVVVVPLVQKRGYAIALLQQTEAARVQAEAADGVRREFERLQSDYNYALARKYTYPGTVQIIDDITRVLPDDTWLSQLELKTTQKGKDTQRDVFLRGESANGSKLISLLEDSKRVEQAALRSPTTKLQPGPGEVFDLGAQLKVISPPPSEIVGGPPPAQTPAAAPGQEAVPANAAVQPSSPGAGKVPDPATPPGSAAAPPASPPAPPSPAPVTARPAAAPASAAPLTAVPAASPAGSKP
jgi:general secretion pathway protein L